MVLNGSKARKSPGHGPKKHWVLVLTHIASLALLALLLWDWAAGRLSFNPIRDLTLRTGRYTLTLLILSLTCSPAYLVSGFRPLIRMRRALGLYAFMYAGLHLLTFVGLDFGFNVNYLSNEIVQRPYIQVGLLAFLLLLALAVTSWPWSIRRLGKNWKRLHRLVYVAGLLDIVHFWWIVRGDIRRPLIAGTVLVLLLLARIPAVKRLLIRLRAKVSPGA